MYFDGFCFLYLQSRKSCGTILSVRRFIVLLIILYLLKVPYLQLCKYIERLNVDYLFFSWQKFAIFQNSRTIGEMLKKIEISERQKAS
jgi:hypothetical protein